MDQVIELIKMCQPSERIQWAMTLKKENKIIGTIGYHRIEKDHYRAEIGYMLHRNYGTPD